MSRFFQMGVVAFWIVSMSWLVFTQLIPHLSEDSVKPRSTADYFGHGESTAEVGWQIAYANRPVGSIVQRTERSADGTVKIHSRVRFDDLPLEDAISSILGPLGSFIRPTITNHARSAFPFTVDIDLELDRSGLIRGATATAGIRDDPEILRLTGFTVGGQFRYVVEVPSGDKEQGAVDWQDVYRGAIDIGRAELSSDSLIPYSRLQNLKVGDTWMSSTFGPVSAVRGVERVRATVVCLTETLWHEDTVKAFRVDFEPLSRTASNQHDKTSSQLWVIEDGRIIQQRVRFGSTSLVLQRMVESGSNGHTSHD